MPRSVNQGKVARSVAVEREMKFFIAFFDENSPIKGNLEYCAVAAGFSPNNARFSGQRLLDRYAGKSFRDSTQALGLTKPYLAAKVREIIEDKKSKAETKLTAIKMLLNNFGEKTDPTSSTVNINTPKALVVVGTSQKKIDAMLQPQLEENVRIQPSEPQVLSS